ncbi:hypothetical protein BIW11_08715 [Tropilaelaps mercedesae]|uniref:Kinetochore protein SPC25 n=1 Tax=Tropilaelaps mercedesae TaxID=418985 RepID=A0A1V9XNQ1_9ACAR|nr:hypothetical protein BIW11_08715 [Tropilaelaps mercedesae]
MARLIPRGGDEIAESEMGPLEFALNVMRPTIDEIKPQFTYVPRTLQPINVDLECLDKFIMATKEKISLMADMDTYAEFDINKRTAVEKVRELQNKVNRNIASIKELATYQYPMVSFPEPGIARVDIAIDARKAWFEISCDSENNCFRGIRSDPPVEKFETLASEQPVLNELIATMTRRFRKVFAQLSANE